MYANPGVSRITALKRPAVIGNIKRRWEDRGVDSNVVNAALALLRPSRAAVSRTP